MSIYDGTFRMFLKHRALLAPVAPDAHALCVGHADYIVRPGTVRREDVPEAFLTASKFLFEERWLHVDFWNVVSQLSRDLCTLFFGHLGYPRYSTLDLQRPEADLHLDLNAPLPDDCAGHFDLVWDNSTIEHALNVGQALANVARLTKLGGKLVLHQAIGDQNNGGYWTVTPDVLKDFLEANGFRIDVMDCFDQRGNSFPWRVHHSAFVPVTAAVPLRYLPGATLRRMRTELSARLFLAKPALKAHLTKPMTRAWSATAAGRARRAQFWGTCQRIVDTVFGLNQAYWIGGPVWTVFCVATKLQDVPSATFPVQAIYRKAS